MINDKNTLPVLTKEQRINLKIEEIEKLINLIGWDNWDLRVQLNCRLLELKELINDNQRSY